VCVPIVSDLSLLLLKSFDALVNRGGERAFRFGFCICSRDLAISCVMCNYLVVAGPAKGVVSIVLSLPHEMALLWWCVLY
jgi:hypothetical protein